MLAELGQLRSADIVLPTAELPPRELRLRCVVRPDRAQALLLDRLGLRLPTRLRISPEKPKCSADSVTIFSLSV